MKTKTTMQDQNVNKLTDLGWIVTLRATEGVYLSKQPSLQDRRDQKGKTRYCLVESSGDVQGDPSAVEAL